MKKTMIGFACAYAPLPIMAASGFTPYRVLPRDISVADGAGRLLHENLCPHIKMVLERAVCGDIPAQMEGMVFVNSCDAMRRLKDAWEVSRPDDKTILLDLPLTANPVSLDFWTGEIKRLAAILSDWAGKAMDEGEIMKMVDVSNSIADKFSILRKALREGRLPGGAPALQNLYNAASEEPLENTIKKMDDTLKKISPTPPSDNFPGIFLLGNVMPSAEFFSFFASCGANIVAEDMCTGSRVFQRYDVNPRSGDIFAQIAKAILTKPPCARTFDCKNPGVFGEQALSQIKQSGATAVIVHAMKFCDPYLARLPLFFEALEKANIPFLFLEGDCSLRSLGQYKTRVEAFVETLQWQSK